MKKLLLLSFLFLPLIAKADPLFITPAQPDPFSVLSGQLTGALITHVHAVDQVTSKGNKIALLDSVLLLGHLKEDYIAQTRVGYDATRNADGTFVAGGFQISEFFPINNIVNSIFTVPSQYEMIQNLQYGPSVGYSFGDHHDFFSLDVGYRFGINTTK